MRLAGSSDAREPGSTPVTATDQSRAARCTDPEASAAGCHRCGSSSPTRLLGHDSVDKSWHTAAAVAGRGGDWQGLLLASVRRGHETKNQGGNDAPNASRTRPDPVDYASPSMLGKMVYGPSPVHEFGLTLETQRRTQDTRIISARALPPLVASSTLDLWAHDRLERSRASLEHRYAPRGSGCRRPRRGFTRRTQMSASSPRKTATPRPTARATTATGRTCAARRRCSKATSASRWLSG